MSTRNGELPAMTGEGVEALTIKEIDKCVAKYEREKDARVKLTPGEVAAKQELRQALHKHRDKLPRNEDGDPYYRIDGVDYVLEETLKRKKVSTDETGEQFD